MQGGKGHGGEGYNVGVPFEDYMLEGLSVRDLSVRDGGVPFVIQWPEVLCHSETWVCVCPLLARGSDC